MAEGFVREVAHRIFAAEFKESNLQVKEGSDQYTPQYLITPTGAKVNRVFIVGTLTEKEDVGSEAEFWRGRIVDPTGAFFVSAGQYQPEAAQVLARTTPPEFIAVIGKPSTYTTKDGNVLTSIRAESMQVVDAATRDRWVVDAAMHTAKRLEKLAGNEPNAVKAREHYSTNVEAYRLMVAQALESVKEGAANDSNMQRKEQNSNFAANSIGISELKQKKKSNKIVTHNNDKEWENELESEELTEIRENLEGMQGDYDSMKYYCEVDKDPHT